MARLPISVSSIKRAETGRQIRYRVATCLAEFFNMEIEQLSNESLYIEERGVEVIFPVAEVGDCNGSEDLQALKKKILEKKESRSYCALCLVLEVRHQALTQLLEEALTGAGVLFFSTNTYTHILINTDESGFESFELFSVLVSVMQEQFKGDVRMYGDVITGLENDVFHVNHSATYSSLLLDRIALYSANYSGQLFAVLEWGGVMISQCLAHSDCCHLDSVLVISAAGLGPLHRQVWYLVARHQSSFVDIVGRQFELAQLNNLLRCVEHDQIGQTLHIHGMAGIGKSILINRFVSSLVMNKKNNCDDWPNLVLLKVQQQCLRYHCSPGRLLISRLLGLSLGVSLEKFMRALVASGLGSELQRVAMDLADIILPEKDQMLLDLMPESYRSTQQVNALSLLIELSVKKGTLVVIVDDGHTFSGDAKRSQRFLLLVAALVKAGACKPLLLIVCSRNMDSLVDSVQCLDGVHNFELKALPAAEASVLATEFIASKSKIFKSMHLDVEAAIAPACGNPRYIRQRLLASMMAASYMGSTKLSEQESQAPLQVQLQALSFDSRLRIKLTALMVPMEAAQARCLWSLEKLTHLVLLGWLKKGVDGYCFAHPLLQQEVINGITSTEWPDYHRFCADNYMGSNLSRRLHHRVQAGDRSAMTELLNKIYSLIGDFDFDKALVLLNAVLSGPSHQLQVTFLQLKAKCMVASYTLSEAIVCYEQALSEAHNSQQIRDICFALTPLYQLTFQQHQDTPKKYRENFLTFGQWQKCKMGDLEGSMALAVEEMGQCQLFGAYSQYQIHLCKAEQDKCPLLIARYSQVISKILREQLVINEAIRHSQNCSQLANIMGDLQLEMDTRLLTSDMLLGSLLLTSATTEIDRGLAVAHRAKAPHYRMLFLERKAKYYYYSKQRAMAEDTIKQSLQIMHSYPPEAEMSVRLYATLALVSTDEKTKRKSLNQSDTNIKVGCNGFWHSYPQAIFAAWELRDSFRLAHYEKLLSRNGSRAISPRQELYLSQIKLALALINDRANVKDLVDFNHQASFYQIKSARLYPKENSENFSMNRRFLPKVQSIMNSSIY